MAIPSSKRASTTPRRRGLARDSAASKSRPKGATPNSSAPLAETFRGDPARAEALRSLLRQALIDPQVESAFDVFGSDLPDEAFAGVFDQPRQKGWREIDI